MFVKGLLILIPTLSRAKAIVPAEYTVESTRFRVKTLALLSQSCH